MTNEANFEALESLIRKQKGQARNEGVRVELEYSSEEYDEEIESQPRLLNETTHTLMIGYPIARRSRGKVVVFEGIQERTMSGAEREDKHNEIREQKMGKIKG
ncbi:hypothetical protein Tco_1000906, partial [Tanacetum coccineum]